MRQNIRKLPPAVKREDGRQIRAGQRLLNKSAPWRTLQA